MARGSEALAHNGPNLDGRGYRVVEGDSGKIEFSPAQLTSYDTTLPRVELYPGIYFRGHYTVLRKGQLVALPVVSFLYHKYVKQADESELGALEPQLETTERLVIITGWGEGVKLPDHEGQVPTTYLIGAKIGTVEPSTGEPTFLYSESAEIRSNHFQRTV